MMCCGETLCRMSSAVSDICSLNRSTVAASSARLRSDSRLNSSTDRVMTLPSWICFRTNSRYVQWFLGRRPKRRVELSARNNEILASPSNGSASHCGDRTMRSALWLLRPIATGELHSPATTTDRRSLAHCRVSTALPSATLTSQLSRSELATRRLRPVRAGDPVNSVFELPSPA